MNEEKGLYDDITNMIGNLNPCTKSNTLYECNNELLVDINTKLLTTIKERLDDNMFDTNALQILKGLAELTLLVRQQ